MKATKELRGTLAGLTSFVPVFCSDSCQHSFCISTLVEQVEIGHRAVAHSYDEMQAAFLYQFESYSPAATYRCSSPSQISGSCFSLASTSIGNALSRSTISSEQ